MLVIMAVTTIMSLMMMMVDRGGRSTSLEASFVFDGDTSRDKMMMMVVDDDDSG